MRAIDADKLKPDCMTKDGRFAISQNQIANAKPIQPSTDAVSRQAVKEQMIKYGFYAPDMTVTEFVEELPPVTPTRPKGHWVYKEGIYGVPFCNRCNFELTINDTNFCPNCGADMREGEV